MPRRSLTQILDAHHDKLDAHTAALQKIDADIDHLSESVSALEAKLAKAEEKDENSGLRASLRDWLADIRDLM